MNDSFRATLAEPPPEWREVESFRPGGNKTPRRADTSVLDSAGDWLTSVVSHARFSLGLPQDNTFRRNEASRLGGEAMSVGTNQETFADKLRTARGMGSLSMPNPERLDYYDPEPTEAENKKAKASTAAACGVGITFAFDEEEDAVVVTQLVKDAPAARTQRVELGDYLLEVDGIAVRGQPLEVVHSIVRGIEGSHCAMAFYRPGEDERQDATFVVNMLRERLDEITEYTVPSKCGVGITFETVALDGSARVKALVRGSDAEQCGLIVKGDVLYEVDRTNVFREPLDIVADLIMGDENSKVRLLFLRGTRTFVEVFVTRVSNLRISDKTAILAHSQHTTRIAAPVFKESDAAEAAAMDMNDVGAGSIMGMGKQSINTNSSRSLQKSLAKTFSIGGGAPEQQASSTGSVKGGVGVSMRGASNAASSVVSRGSFAPPTSSKPTSESQEPPPAFQDLPWDKPPSSNPPKKSVLGPHPTGMF